MALDVTGLTAMTAGDVTNISALTELKFLWAKTFGDPLVCVAILDGVVDQSHPCFDGANITRLQTLISDVADRGHS